MNAKCFVWKAKQITKKEQKKYVDIISLYQRKKCFTLTNPFSPHLYSLISLKHKVFFWPIDSFLFMPKKDQKSKPNKVPNWTPSYILMCNYYLIYFHLIGCVTFFKIAFYYHCCYSFYFIFKKQKKQFLKCKCTLYCKQENVLNWSLTLFFFWELKSFLFFHIKRSL